MPSELTLSVEDSDTWTLVTNVSWPYQWILFDDNFGTVAGPVPMAEPISFTGLSGHIYNGLLFGPDGWIPIPFSNPITIGV
jgi:hypothetical protein